MPDFTFAPYQPATYCSHRAQPGNIYLAAFIQAVFPETRLLNIESCRDIVGGSALSHHAEGRANDEGVPQGRQPSGKSVGYQIVEILAPHGRELGIDHIIANTAPWESGRGRPMTWSASSPGGRVYTGLHPHKDHDHIGLTRVAARDLTLSKIQQAVLGVAPIPPPVPVPPPIMGFNMSWAETPKATPQEIGQLQDLINETYYIPKGQAGLTVEQPPRWGTGTSAAVRKWLVPKTGDTDPKVLAGERVNYNMFNGLLKDWVREITR